MFNKKDNSLTQEVKAFSGYPWKNYGDNAPMISLTVNDGYGRSVDQFLTVGQAEQVIELLQSLIEQARVLPENEYHDLNFDDNPF